MRICLVLCFQSRTKLVVTRGDPSVTLVHVVTHPDRVADAGLSHSVRVVLRRRNHELTDRQQRRENQRQTWGGVEQLLKQSRLQKELGSLLLHQTGLVAASAPRVVAVRG